MDHAERFEKRRTAVPRHGEKWTPAFATVRGAGWSRLRSQASESSATVDRRDLSTTTRGAITAYFRVAQAAEGLAIETLSRNGFYACRDDGDPDRPPGTRDIYVSRHYGMTNPGQGTIELHHIRAAELLRAAGVDCEDVGGGVVWGVPIPAAQLLPVCDARTRRPTGYTVRGATYEEVEERIRVLAETLGVDRTEIVVDYHDPSAAM